MEDEDDAILEQSPRRKLGVAMFVVLLQLLVILGLVRAFAPDFTSKAMESVLNTFNVTITAPPPPPEPAKAPDKSGAAGDAGKKAVAREVKAEKPKVELAQQPAPRASSTGSANTSGAAQAGAGTGAGGSGNGPGAGGSGNGSGGGMAVKPSVRSGEINDSRDFPIPPGGRQTRFGKSVIVVFTVTTDGRAQGCAVKSSSVDADTTARVCPLVMQRIRFNPAKRADGTAIEARYGYRVDFTAR